MGCGKLFVGVQGEIALPLLRQADAQSPQFGV